QSTLAPLATLSRIGVLQAINHGFGPLLDLICVPYDIFHASNQVRVAPRRVRLTATLHDMTCWLMPEVHTEANVRADAGFARNILARADRLIAVSEHTRQDAIRFLGLRPEKIQVIHSGIGDAFFQSNAGEAERVRARFGLQRPYILTLGTVEPRKNLDRLLDAYATLAADVREQFTLVVAGPRGWQSEKTIARLSGAGSGIRYLGYVAEGDLPGLLAGATVFAYPSLYEGFGFPLAEAMASGVASLTSNVSSLPEVAGDAALMVDPRSVGEIGAALSRLLTSPSLRAGLSAAARRRAEKFRWERAARESIQFFEQVAGHCGR
ncbi:MAG: glycosyltransferase family 1 protein, partial [Acidobacteria bacterium]|nr:glycosyltransferase family 1 protein [Acidobacteriota bacterium]